MRKLLCFLISALICGCMSYSEVKIYPANMRANIAPEQLTKIRKVLLIGPVVNFIGDIDAKEGARLKGANKDWQLTIAAYWTAAKQRGKSSRDLILPNDKHYEMLAGFLNEQNLDKIHKYNTKTGALNTDYEKRIMLALGKLAANSNVDAILLTYFVIVSAEVEKSFAKWDEQIDYIVSSSTEEGSYSGKVPALSLRMQFINKDGLFLTSSQSGYKALIKIRIKKGDYFFDEEKRVALVEALEISDKKRLSDQKKRETALIRSIICELNGCEYTMEDKLGILGHPRARHPLKHDDSQQNSAENTGKQDSKIAIQERKVVKNEDNYQARSKIIREKGSAGQPSYGNASPYRK